MVSNSGLISPHTIDDRVESLSCPREAAELLLELETLKRKIDASIAKVVATVDRNIWFSDDGHLTASTWVRGIINVTVSEAKRVGKVADLAQRYPAIVEREANGTLGVAQITRLAGLHANRRVTDRLPDFIDMLVGYAESLPYDDFNTVATRWEQLADADGAHRDHAEVHEGRDFHVSTAGTATYVDGRFGNAQGALIAEVFERFVQAELQKDVSLRDALGDPPTMLPRTTKQRRADAAYAIFAAAARQFPAAPEPLVSIMIDQATYERTLAALEKGERLPSLVQPGDNLLDKRCETTGGVHLDPVDVVGASLVGRVRRVVMNAAGVPIDMSRRARVFTGPGRAAVLVRRRRCIWPGCNLLSCELDHRVPWVEGGATDVANGDPLCRRHNRTKVRGFLTRYDECTRTTFVIRPDGHPMVPV
ncbi:MAG: DUF222 domain-containing protein [Ilumatobacteraceae bacterium]